MTGYPTDNSDAHDGIDEAATAGQDPNEGIDLDVALGETGEDDVRDRSYVPNDRPVGAFHHGNTVQEQVDGQTLDERLDAEVPDVGEDTRPGGSVMADLGDDATGEDVSVEDTVVGDGFEGEVGDDRAGRLVAPDEGAHADEEKDLVAEDVGIDAGAAGAEEAAMHIVADPRT